MSQDIEALLPKLAEAVHLMMDPKTPQTKRLEAYQACEDFKENSDLCSACGARMTVLEQPDIIKHFGLQLMEHCVKYRWYKMSVEEKLFIRQHIMQMMASGTRDILSEQLHIKDVLSRVVVEMMKREWPQHWPSLLTELDALCKQGAVQTELVLLTFLRLAEDVVAFQTVPTQRRRDMLSAVTSSLSELFAFFLTTLHQHTQLYKEKGCSVEAAAVDVRLCYAVLRTLTGYVDWVPMSHITASNSQLLQILCQLLSQECLRLPAVECLLLITARKGKAEERKPLLVLLSREAMETILHAALPASSAPLAEHQYLFLKKLCQVLTSIGTQLASLWGSENKIGCPDEFSSFLQAILAFQKHPGQVLGSLTQCLWASFLRHEEIRNDSVLLEHLPRLLETCKMAMYKVGFPSQNNHPSCAYSQLDFDTDPEWAYFYSRYRAEVADTVRCVTQVAPNMAFQLAAIWLNDILSKPQDLEPCTLSSPAFIEWDALAIFLESVMKVWKVSDSQPSWDEYIKIFKASITYQTLDPLILSSQLSCMSALFPFIEMAPDTLPVIVDKIFAAAVFNQEGQTKGTRSRAVKNVRRHACSILIKACKQYPLLLLPGFQQLYNHIKQLGSDPEQLSTMEKCTLMESLIILSNEFRDFTRQCDFVGEILEPLKHIWLSESVRNALVSSQAYLAYIGLDQAPVEPSHADTCGINRSHVSYCVTIILAVIKRSTCPVNTDERQAGGFTAATPDNTQYWRNPCMPHIGAMLDNLLALLRTTNLSWSPDNLRLRHAQYVAAYNIMEPDRLSALGLPPPVNCPDNASFPTHKSPVERMKNFLSITHETVCHVLGNAGPCLGREYYSAPGLGTTLVNYALTGLEHVPDFRLRCVIRSFLKPHIASCPAELYATAVLPLLAHFAPFMLQRLNERWATINERADEGLLEDEEDAQSQEILEEQLVRLVTRDYMDLVTSLMRPIKAEENSENGEESMGNGDLTNNHTPMTPCSNQDTEPLSKLGQMIFSDAVLSAPFTLVIFSGLTWADSATVHKCCMLVVQVGRRLSMLGNLNAEDAQHLLSLVFTGLERHGQHDGLQQLLVVSALRIYELLKPAFTEQVSAVMLMVPNSTPEKLQSLNAKLFPSDPTKAISEKKKREAFKTFISEIIGKNLCEKFKRKQCIKNLPPMLKLAHRKKAAALDETGVADMGICALFGDSSK